MNIIGGSRCGAAILLVAGSMAWAAPLTVNVTAHVTSIDDAANILGGQLSVGQTVTGTYTYETSVADQEPHWAYGHYPQYPAQARTRLSAGSLVFESDSASPGWGYNMWTHSRETDSDHSYFRIGSLGNKPLANGASVRVLDFNFTDPAGNAPLSDALPIGAPDLASFPTRSISVAGDLNGDIYHVALQIDAVEAAPPPGSLVLSPASGSFVRPQRFDAAVILPPGSQLSSLQARVDGSPSPVSYPGSCDLAPPNAMGRPAVVCPDAQSLLPASGGIATVEWRAEFTDGRVLTGTVDWELIP